MKEGEGRKDRRKERYIVKNKGEGIKEGTAEGRKEER